MTKRVVLGLAAAITSQYPQYAADALPPPSSTNNVRLEPVVVLGTLEEDPITEVPSSVTVIPNSTLTQSPSLPEALKTVPGVMIQKTSRGQGSPFIRGFTGFRNLMLIDGIRLNNSVFREGPNQYWNTVDPLSLDRLEVMKGPASVLYGSDAIGGTVNAITRSRQEYGPGWNWDRSAYYRVSSAESSHITRGQVDGNFGETFGFLIGGGVKEFGDLRGGNNVGRQSHTGFSEYDWDAKFDFLVQPNAKLTLAHETVDQNDVWRTHSTRYGIDWNDATHGTDQRRSLDQHRDLTYIQYHLENTGAFVDEVRFSLSHHLQEEDEHRIPANRTQHYQGFDVNTLGTFLHLHSRTPAGHFIYGAEFYHDWVDSYSERYLATGAFNRRDLQGPVADDATYQTIGFFITDQIPIGEHFELFPGIRYTGNRADAEKVQEPGTNREIQIKDDYDAFTGSLRAMWHIDPESRWNVFAGVSQGFRAPNLSDLTRYDIARSGELEIPATGLDPEEFISYEAGLKVNFERFFGEVAYFYTDIDEMIVRIPTGQTVLVNGTPAVEVTKGNSGSGYVNGVEVAADYNFIENWTALGRFTWSEGEIDTFASTTSAPVYQREYLSRVMPLTAQIGLRYDMPWWNLSAEFFSTMADGQDKLSSGDTRDTDRIPPGGTPGYAVFDFGVTWRPWENFTLRGRVENIGDRDYRIHGSGVNEPGRNFILAMDVKF